jgi:hypothetical protein
MHSAKCTTNSRRCGRAWATWTGGVGTAILLWLAASGTRAQDPVLGDPLPLQRVVIPMSRLPAELEKQKVLVQMPRDEFEALVQRAARAGDPARGAARLIKSAYSAELAGNCLVGSGQWTIHHSGKAPTVMPVPHFSPALSKIHWAGGGDAVLGALDGPSLGLFVEKAGEVFFDWSQRGALFPGGLRFELGLPSCPVGTLELKVPADHQVLVPKNTVLLSGPSEAEQQGMRIWRFQFSGRSQVEFQIRRPPDTQQTAELFVSQLQARQQITPDRLAADFDFQIEVLHTSVRELVFDCDPSLQPYEVSIRNAHLKAWDFKAAEKKVEMAPKPALQQPATLTVRLREPFQGTVQGLKIRCLAPRPMDQPWTSPTIRPRLASARGETLKISVHPEVQLESWDAAAFRLLSSATEGDGSLVLTLTDTATGLDASRRPVAVFKSQGFEVVARQHTWWHIGPKGATLTAEIAYESARGSIFQLPIKLPVPNNLWRVEAVDLEPKEALRGWVTAGPLLLVDLRRGLNPRSPAKLSVRLVERSESVPAGPRDLDIPVLEPLDAGAREGTLAISVDPLFQVALRKASAPLAAPEKQGAWGTLPPQYFFRYHDSSVSGQVRLLPQKARVRARCREDIVLLAGQGSLHVRLEVEPIVGSPAGLDLFVFGYAGAALNWQVEGNTEIVRALERQYLPEALPFLRMLGARDRLQAAVLAAQLPSVQRWRLRFNRPLVKRETIVLRAPLEPRVTAELPVGPIVPGALPMPVPAALLPPRVVAGQALAHAQRWDIPILVVPEADRQDAEITVEAAGLDLAHVKATGLEEIAAQGARREVVREAWRAFRFGPWIHEYPPQLSMTAQSAQAAAPAREWCDQALLTTYVDSEAHLLHHFRFHAWNWHTRELVVRLPPGTQKVLAAKVDGRWLEQLVQEEVENGRQVKLPAAMDLEGHRFELYYLTEASWSGWPTWADLEALPPQLPVTPLSFRRTWCLAPGLQPLDQERLQSLSDVPGRAHDFRLAWHMGDPVLAELLPGWGDNGSELQRQVLLGAESGLRRKLTREMTLGEALDRLAHEFLKEQLPLVIDRAALRAADVRPDASLAPLFAAPGGSALPFWEALGLVCVSFPSGPVFTTQTQLKAWQHLFGRGAELQNASDSAVAEAIAHDHDVRGRFVTLGHWLRTERKADPSPAPLFLPTGEGWTVWEPQSGRPETAHLRVFQAASLRSLGIFLGLLSLWLAWRIGRLLSFAWSFRLVVVWLASLGLAFVWLPAALQPVLSWPFLAAVFWCCGGIIRIILLGTGVKRRTSKSTEIAKVLIGSSTLWLLFVPGSLLPHGRSGGTEPPTVLLVESEPGRQLALVNQELLKKLEALERRGSTPSGAAVLSGRYQGTMKANVAEFTATYEIHNFSDKAKLLLPLTGVELQEGAYLDGAPVFPVASAGLKAGYLVAVDGKGPHRLVLSFTVRSGLIAEYQEVRFSVPKLCMNSVEWTTSGSVQGLHLVTGMGDEKVTKRSANVDELKANLGREGTVQIRWRVNHAPAVPAVAEVREAYFWDLRAGVASLSAALQFAPVKGTLTHLALEMPEGIEVRSLEAASGNQVMGPPLPTLLKRWYFTGKGNERHLHVDLTGPVANRVLLHMDLLPRINLATGKVLLRLPLPLTGKQSESFLAYRAEGWDVVDKTQNLGVTSIAPDVFGKVWADSGQKDPGRASRAYSFRRTAGNAGLELTLTSQRLQGQAEVAWTLHPHHADFVASLRLTSTGEGFSFLEADLSPGVTLTDVRGPTLHHWSRQKARVQIWLQQPRKQVILELTGWAPLAQKIAGAKPGRFLLPSLQIPNVRLDAVQVKVQASPGVRVEVERLLNLAKGAAPNTFTATNAVHEGSFLIRQMPVQAEVRILTTAEVRQNACLLIAHFHCQAPLGSPGPMRVVLRGCSAVDVRLEFPGTSPRIIERTLGSDHFWELVFPPDVAQPVTFQLQARIELKDLTKFLMPDVTAQEVQVVDRWLAVTGPELRPEKKQGLAAVQNVVRELRLWPGEAQRIQSEGTAWQVRQADWSLPLEVRLSGDAPAVKVLLAEEQAFLADGLRWLHQTDFLLAARGDTDLKFALPAEARLLAMTLDERAVMPRPVGPQTYGVPLGGPSGPRTLRVRWQYASDAEPLDRPKVGGAYLLGVTGSPVEGRLLVPPGFEAASLPDGVQSSSIRHLLARAQAHMDLCRFLANQATADVTPALFSAQKNWSWAMRQADLQVSYLADPEEKTSGLAALAELRKENERLLQEKGFESLRTPAEKYPADLSSPARPLFAVPEQGTAVFWRLPDVRRTAMMSLTDGRRQHARTARRWSEFLALAAVALLVLSSLPRGLACLGCLWPELCALGGVIGMLVLGFSFAGVLVVGLGVLGRVLWAVRALRRSVLFLFRSVKVASTLQPK